MSSPKVFGVCYRLKMMRINAIRIAASLAEMVEF